MAYEQGPERSPEDRDTTLWVLVGVGLIVLGMFYGAHALDLVPSRVDMMFDYAGRARTGIGILVIGIALLVWARSDRRFTSPPRGAKLYRSRDEKWISGVLGGLAEYFGMDVTLLRLAFIALVVLFGLGSLVVAYIVMALVVPLEPEKASAVSPPPPL